MNNIIEILLSAILIGLCLIGLVVVIGVSRGVISALCDMEKGRKK